MQVLPTGSTKVSDCLGGPLLMVVFGQVLAVSAESNVGEMVGVGLEAVLGSQHVVQRREGGLRYLDGPAAALSSEPDR